MYTYLPGPPHARRARLSLVTMFLLAVTSFLQAQEPLKDTVLPRREIYNLGLDEYWIGGVLATKPPDTVPYRDLWGFLRDIGVKVLEMREHEPSDYWHVDTLAATAAPDEWLIPNLGGALSRAGNGREVIFFPFDSAQSYYYRNVFAQRSGGITQSNAVLGGKERVYDAATTTPNEVVASQIAFGYITGQKRWPVPDDTALSTMDCSSFITNQIEGLGSPMHYITVAGHMFNPNGGGGNASVGPNDSVLTVEIWCEIPKGTTYRNASGVKVTAATDIEYLFRSFDVLKGSLVARGFPADWDVYHDTILTIDMQTAPGTLLGGPYHPDNSEHRFDIRVRWTGREKVALRSLTLHDQIGRLMRGHDAVSQGHRDSILNLARRIVLDSSAAPPVPRRAVMRVYTGDEGKYFEHGPYEAIDSMLYSTFNTGNAQTRGVRAYRAQNYHSNSVQHTLDDQPELSVELYWGDMWYRRGGDNQQFFGVTDLQLPALAEHNGGRWFVPLMQPARAEVERYERFLQRFHIAQYVTGPNDEDFYGSRFANELGHAAWSSRRTGKRLTIWPSTMAPFNIYPIYTTDDVTGTYVRTDTTWTHIIEPAELRTIVNLGLVYGSRGVHYSWIGSDTQEVYPIDRALHPLDTVQRWKFYNDFGPVGPLTSMQENHRDTFVIRRKPVNDGLGRPEARFPDFYTGWGNRLDEMRWLNRNWLPRIGAAMARLRWRDGYSIHFTTTQWYMPASIRHREQSRSRPLPAGEIVREIRTVDRYGTMDSLAATYVELGLFDTQKGSTPIRDTNYIMVLNRRAFERTSDISDTTLLGRTLDSLSEVRTLRIRLNMQNPAAQGGDQYNNFVHITDVAPDSTPLPFTKGALRRGLDTVVHADSLFTVTLRPGGAALLRITYCDPNDSLAVGDIRFNNGRRIVFDGRYWHAVYFRKGDFRYPPSKLAPGLSDQVYYRRSLPVDSSLGIIRWDPRLECNIMVSDTNDPVHCVENRFPSLTVRDDSSRPGERVVTVVWSSYTASQQGHHHDVLVRNIRVPDDVDAFPTMSPIEIVGSYFGRTDSAWGTPVVSRLHGGDMFAWSDSTAGIMARFRRLAGGAAWWNQPGVYSAFDSVSRPYVLVNAGLPSQYPSMPPFAHVKGRDSSIALVWQQQVIATASPMYEIRYARLVDSVDTLTGMPAIAERNHFTVSPANGWRHMHPSIDMTQNVWFGAQEGVAWESWTTALNKGVTEVKGRVHFSSLWTETARGYDSTWIWYDSNSVQHVGGRWRPYHDSIEQVWQWTQNSMQIVTTAPSSYMYSYPSTASLNARIDTNHALDSIYFAIALARTQSYLMRQVPAQYATSFLWSQPMQYLYGGYNPNATASLTRQAGRQSVLYADETTTGKLETTRQFFAKTRPRGYMAYGRIVHVPIDEATHTAISGAMHDVWYAGDGGIGALRLAVRPDSLRCTDSLNAVRRLMRTGCFHAHDSTTIGCELWGRFAGDTSVAGGMRVEFIAELVDSATDQVVRQLDSFSVAPGGAAPGLDSHEVALESVYDLLSGTYYVRLRIEPVNVTVERSTHRPLYPVEEYASYVEDELFGKMRRLSAGASQGRITAQPNPVPDRTELRFSVPATCRTSVIVYDGAGREVRRLVDDQMIETGRYAIDFDTDGLPEGSYLVEFRYGTRRAVEKIVVVR